METAAFQEHKSFFESQTRDAFVNGNRQYLCSTSECRAVFDPNKVPLSKRCSIRYCTEIRAACGCEIKTCSTCHDIFCRTHFRDQTLSCTLFGRTKMWLLWSWRNLGAFLLQQGYKWRSFRVLVLRNKMLWTKLWLGVVQVLLAPMCIGRRSLLSPLFVPSGSLGLREILK